MNFSPGAVYLLHSQKHPGVVKIGKTKRAVEVRVEELTVARGYRGFAPFLVLAVFHTRFIDLVEPEAHRRLDRYRITDLDITGISELFRVDPNVAVEALGDAVMTIEASEPLVFEAPKPPGRARIRVPPTFDDDAVPFDLSQPAPTPDPRWTVPPPPPPRVAPRAGLWAWLKRRMAPLPPPARVRLVAPPLHHRPGAILVFVAFMGFLVADCSGALGQPMILEDGRGRPAGRIEQDGPGRYRLQDHYGRPQGTIEQQPGGRVIQRDWRGIPVDPRPSPGQGDRDFLRRDELPERGNPRY